MTALSQRPRTRTPLGRFARETRGLAGPHAAVARIAGAPSPFASMPEEEDVCARRGCGAALSLDEGVNGFCGACA